MSHFPLKPYLKQLAFWLTFLFLSTGLAAQDDINIESSYTIEEDVVEEYANVNLPNVNTTLRVNGTLTVHQNLNIDGNQSVLSIGSGGTVIIYGDLNASNLVEIIMENGSFLVIHGNLIKQGASEQGEIDANHANIYVFGEVENWVDDLNTCGEYDGDTTEIDTNSCDYGTEEDFKNNYDDFPPELIDIVNCYNLSAISDSEICEGETAYFQVDGSPEVNFQWQEKIPGGEWKDLENEVAAILAIPDAVLSQSGNEYRVITTPKDPESSCKISISRTVTLRVKREGLWTGTENSNWNNASNWSCNTLPTLETNVLIPEFLASGNYPEISTGKNALAKDLSIENTATLRVKENWLRIAGDLSNSGTLNTETGGVSFEGSDAQTIPTSAFENNRIQNLRINNASGVTSEAIIEITQTLKVEAGNFDTGNELTLISTEDHTALIDGSGNGEVTGLINMQRYFDSAFGYKYFSSPFQNSVVGDFAPYMNFQDPVSGFPHFYRYDENRRVDSINLDATGWEVYTNIGNNINIAEGYALNFGISADAQTIELIGEVNNGAIPAKQLLNHHREWTKGFHLVGNPYPSPIDWEASQGWTRNNIDDGIYFFTASDTSQYTGTYTTYVNNTSTVDGRSSNIIPSMQGFFIKVSDSETQDLVTGSFGMNNKVRVTNFDQEFLKSQVTDLKSLIRLEAGFNTADRTDPMVIYFSSYATQNFEKEMDAHKLMNTDPAVPSFYNITDNKKELAINAIPFPESKSYKRIPLGIKADQSGEMKINLASVENLSPKFNIYLIDNVKSKGQNLRRKPEYSFSIKAGTHNSRFELMFSEEKITSPAIAFNEPFDVEVEEGNVVVSLNLEENQKGILRASTITAQVLQIKEAGGKDRVVFEGIASDGVYIINLQVGKTQYAKKVLVKK